MISKETLEELTKPLSEKHQNIYYVYQAFVDGELKYIGKGKGKRYLHCLSGASSCPELNRDFHSGKKIEVIKYKEGIPESEAEGLEMLLIDQHKDNGIYNKRFTPDYSSKPNLERMKDVKILANCEEDKFIKQVCGLAPEITASAFKDLVRAADLCGLAVYLAEVKGSKPMIILDKPKRTHYEIEHLGCPNWPCCDVGGCGR